MFAVHVTKQITFLQGYLSSIYSPMPRLKALQCPPTTALWRELATSPSLLAKRAFVKVPTFVVCLRWKQHLVTSEPPRTYVLRRNPLRCPALAWKDQLPSWRWFDRAVADLLLLSYSWHFSGKFGHRFAILCWLFPERCLWYWGPFERNWSPSFVPLLLGCLPRFHLPRHETSLPWKFQIHPRFLTGFRQASKVA